MYLHSVREDSETKINEIVKSLKSHEKLVKNKACVYATGSFGRLEAGPTSDLDLFIVVKERRSKKGPRPALSGLDEIKLKFGLISVAESHDLPDFDGDGKFLSSHTITSYTKWLGSPEDDSRNTLTGRMLMLLESRPLLGSSVYEETIDSVNAKYFSDHASHEENFMPSFLFNDILRMWRTFCVNYEFYRGKGSHRDKLKNRKLKFSRMLTCYSGIIYLQAILSRNNTVRPTDVKAMVALSPTERLEEIAKYEFWPEAIPNNISEYSKTALDLYSEFLELTHKSTSQSSSELEDSEEDWRQRSYQFGTALYQIVSSIGQTSESSKRLLRLISI